MTMAVINANLLLTSLIEIQEKITLLEQELKIQSVFVSIDSNGVFYTHASSKCKKLIDESSELYRMFASGPETKSPSKPMKSEIPEYGSFLALLDECGSSHENDLTSSDGLSLDLKEGNEKINDEISLLGVKGTLPNDVELSAQLSEESYEPCPYCEQLLPGMAFVDQHISQVHTDCRPCKCPHCFSLFEHESELERHAKIHQCRRLFHCTVCLGNFETIGSVKRHECQATSGELESKNKLPREKISTIRLLLCGWCGKTFETDVERQKHRSNHLKTGFKCQKCEARFKTWRILRDHLALVHADAFPFRCHSCNATFKTALLMCRHVEEIHQDNSNGNIDNVSSGSSFVNPGRHPGSIQAGRGQEETLLCSSCGRCFNSEKLMERHMSQVHKEKRSISFTICRQKLRNNDQLETRMVSDHLCTSANAETSSDVCMTCAHCNQHFKKSRDLQAHFQKSNCLVQKSKSAMLTSLPVIEETLAEFETMVDSIQHKFPVEQLFTDPKHSPSSVLRKRKSPWNQKRQQHNFNNLCHVCGKNFTLRHYLRQHLLSHWEWRPFKCQHCNKRFKRQSILQEHLALHSNAKQFHCKICQKKFRFASVVRQHMTVHSSEKVHECDICHKNFKYLSGLKKHRCLSAPYIEATNLFPASENSHLRKDDDRTLVEISPGDKTKRILQLSDPSRPFDCQLCFKRFRLQKDLKRHARVHSEERPFACPLCQKSFKHPSSLRQHQSVHSDDRSYSCDRCSKKFKNASGLKEHMDKNRYKCSECGKQYVHKKSLTSHMVACRNRPGHRIDGSRHHRESKSTVANSVVENEATTLNARDALSSQGQHTIPPCNTATLLQDQSQIQVQLSAFSLPRLYLEPGMQQSQTKSDEIDNTRSNAQLPSTKLWF